MPGKRVQFDEDTWEAVQAVMRQTGKSFQCATAPRNKTPIEILSPRDSGNQPPAPLQLLSQF